MIHLMSTQRGLLIQMMWGCRGALLGILFQSVALMSLGWLSLPQRITSMGYHALIISLIATVGFGIISVIKAIYSYVCAKHKSEGLEQFSERSFMTRTQIFYRAALCMVMILTGGAILMTFPAIRGFGIGIFGSAGVLGLALGLAAKPILLNFVAGFQIAFTNMLKIGDMVVVEGEKGCVEHISLTQVIVKTCDHRRWVLPISYFIDQPFQNWSALSTEPFGVVHLFCDYTMSLDALRKEFAHILEESAFWNRMSWKVDVIDLTENTMKVRFLMSTKSADDAGKLESIVREKLNLFLCQKHIYALPKTRYEEHKSAKHLTKKLEEISR